VLPPGDKRGVAGADPGGDTAPANSHRAGINLLTDAQSWA
jgi:hypothetical protein